MSAYRLCDTDIEIVKIHKHVGVYMSCSLIWRNSVRKYKGKLIGYLPSSVQRNIHSVPTKIKGHAYHALVRPITEYSSTTWSPYTSKGIASIVAIQRRVARFVSNDYRWSASVSSLINEMGWKSLRERRGMSDHILQNPKQQACRAFQRIWLWIRRVLESYSLKLTNYVQPELVLTEILH